MDELSRFGRYEEEFLNSLRIVTRAMRSLELHKDDIGKVVSAFLQVVEERPSSLHLLFVSFFSRRVDKHVRRM